jgi:hypothetical protein
MRIQTALLFLIFGGIDLSCLSAQGTTATILGSVTDSTGAVITEGMIQVTNTGTGERRTAATDSAGRYRVPDLAIGSYDTKASKEGFARVIRKGLTAGSENVVDFTLPVGQTQSTVIVQGDVTEVETTNAAVGALIDQRQTRELPLNGWILSSSFSLRPACRTIMPALRD